MSTTWIRQAASRTVISVRQDEYRENKLCALQSRLSALETTGNTGKPGSILSGSTTVLQSGREWTAVPVSDTENQRQTSTLSP